MTPMVGRRIASIDAGRLDRIAGLQDLLNLLPAVDAEQEIGTGANEWQRRIGRARSHRSRDHNARMHRAIVVRRPADEGSEEHTSELQSLMRISHAVLPLADTSMTTQ